MKLFHGSPFKVSSLKSSQQTGNIRKGEEGRKELRDVVFMTISQDEARHYAGKNGFVYVVEVDAPQQLCTMPVERENRRQSTTIWVARPEKIQILRVICPDGKIVKPFRERNLLGG